MSTPYTDPRRPLPDPQQEGVVQRIRQQIQAHPNLIALFVAAAGVGVAVWIYSAHNAAASSTGTSVSGSGDTTGGTGGQTGGTIDLSGITQLFQQQQQAEASTLAGIQSGNQSFLSSLQSSINGLITGTAAQAQAAVSSFTNASPSSPAAVVDPNIAALNAQWANGLGAILPGNNASANVAARELGGNTPSNTLVSAVAPQPPQLNPNPSASPLPSTGVSFIGSLLSHPQSPISYGGGGGGLRAM